jgi:hypothetical protein
MAITLNRNKFKYKNPSGSGYRNVDLLEEESKVNDVQVDGTSVVTSGVANIDLSGKADKADTVLDTTLSRGRKANTTVGTGSVAFGDNVTASGNYSQTFGKGSVASGLYSFAEGYNVTASSSSSHAEGQSTKATGLNSHAEGFNTIASASSAHAEGGSTVASNGSAHAEGAATVASGDRGSHAEGEYSKATGIASHAEGSYTEANGYGSHAEGLNTVANARGSHVEGMSNVPDSYYDYEEWVPGKQYEVGDKVTRTYAPDNVQGFICTVANNESTWGFQYWKNTMGTMHYAHIVGNGEYNSPSNAYALDWEGNGHFAGDVYVGANADSSGGSKLARESIIAPAEAATATAAHAIGDKFILDGQLCKATAAIAIGDAIATTGISANAEVTQIVDELGSGGGGAVDDVQIDGTSIVDGEGVANIPVIGNNVLGVAKVSNGTHGLQLSSGTIMVKNAAYLTKAGTNAWCPIVPSLQHESAFYGMAKAAGDTTQKDSANAVGTYTETAKSAINSMLNAPETVSGTTPTIAAKAGVQYICGEVSTIDFTPSATGVCDVVFTSGSTPAVLTVPNTVKFPSWFDPTSLDANATYEINVLNGVYGAVMVWA